MARIQLTDNIQSMCVKMVDGNPGALSVCMQMLKEGDKIDPQAVFGGVGQILALDTERIYGSRIWMLYKDVCNENLTKTIALLRGIQLGLIKSTEVQHAIDNYGKGIDVDDVLTKVQEELPNFGKEEE